MRLRALTPFLDIVRSIWYEWDIYNSYLPFQLFLHLKRCVLTVSGSYIYPAIWELRQYSAFERWTSGFWIWSRG